MLLVGHESMVPGPALECASSPVTSRGRCQPVHSPRAVQRDSRSLRLLRLRHDMPGLKGGSQNRHRRLTRQRMNPSKFWKSPEVLVRRREGRAVFHRDGGENGIRDERSRHTVGKDEPLEDFCVCRPGLYDYDARLRKPFFEDRERLPGR